jgi:MarR family transcriptional regulator, 2-MHQ and catechol-resistance regulon repressor
MLTKSFLEIDNIIRYAKTVEQIYIQGEDLSLLQIEALISLSQKNPQTVTDLSICLNINSASTSVLIGRLVKKNLVYREHTDSDRRKVHLFLTSYGIKEQKRLEKKKQEVYSDEQSLLTDDETLFLNKLFAKLTK